MVWKVTVEYRIKATQKRTNNEHINAALGEKQQSHDIDNFDTPTVKFPSQLDEAECIRLFRRCGGPLAATYSGREKLIKEKKLHYGHGRSLKFCRVAGVSPLLSHTFIQFQSMFHPSV